MGHMPSFIGNVESGQNAEKFLKQNLQCGAKIFVIHRLSCGQLEMNHST